MNLTEHYVTEVLEVKFKFGRWFVEVLADSYGRVDAGLIMCYTEEEARAISVGYKYYA